MKKNQEKFIVKPIHPGEILRERLLIPHDISPQELAQALKVPKEQIKWVCEERADITPDLAARLALYFDTSIGLWLNLQRSYEEELAEKQPNNSKLPWIVGEVAMISLAVIVGYFWGKKRNFRKIKDELAN